MNLKHFFSPFTRPSVKSVQGRVNDAIDELEKTVRMTKEELFAKERMEVANDVQHTVVFSTFAEVCRFRTKQGIYVLCRNGAHEASGTGVAACAEELCPLLRTKAMTK